MILPRVFVETMRTDSSVPPPPSRPAILPPADDREALVRHDLRHAAEFAHLRCAAVLCARAPMGDAVAWEAVRRELFTRTRLDDAADCMASGKLDEAVAICARVCGMTVDEWIDETRREIAAKGGV